LGKKKFASLIKSQLHTGSGCCNNHFPLKHLAAQHQLTFLTGLVLGKRYASYHHHITDNFGFICHGTFQTN
jgi:hypothetical protein